MIRTFVASSVLFAGLVVGCGGGAVPAAGPSRESGQSSLMGSSLAGQSCNPKNHERPFVIEWDATDMSMFQGRAEKTGVVFVKYEGCDLTVLDRCSKDNDLTYFGRYDPPEWTSGSVEKLDIANEGELFAKLPLGVATLGGRVKGGETFSMQYFVSGTRTSTRPAVYRGELGGIPGCAGATHYVYGYALGAFELASTKKTLAEADVSVKGVGAGGNRSSSSSAEKKGGVLASCNDIQSAKESRTCSVPIRLMLREVSEGDNPEGNAAGSTPGAATNATRTDQSSITKEETALRESAARKRVQKDGKGCLADFDEADKKYPNSPRLSTLAKGMLNVRAACLMMVGQCDQGKKSLREAYEAMGAMKPETIDQLVKIEADQSCPKK
ncbi:MAG: hypothetical protein KF764_09600 [Labilithrix sp.]|nr:hypothetical protein [Labilithrix sp.]